MNVRTVKRGYDPEDAKFFSESNMEKLQEAQDHMLWLLDRGYKSEKILDLVGGHYQFSKRQRLALMRSTASTAQCKKRGDKKLLPTEAMKGTLYIDGFNLIITMEVAISKSKVLLGNDGVYRDLAGLRGSYKIVDKTYLALDLIGEALDQLKVPKVVFYLDQPVSNSGVLKGLILEKAEGWACDAEVEILRNPDVILMKESRVVTGDKVILDHCDSWFNLAAYMINNQLEGVNVINLSGDHH